MEADWVETAKLTGLIFLMLSGWAWLFRSTFRSLWQISSSPGRFQAGPLEARYWLEFRTGSLAAQRFDSAAVALQFVERLYALGAVSVLVSHVQERPGQRLYADSLVVVLPEDPALRRRLFAMAAAEAAREGLQPEPDTGQETLHLWWD
jgi:hypothetical protein